MFIKTIINQVSIINLLMFILYLINVNYLIVTNNIQKKFFLFTLNIFLIMGLILFYDLDGIALVFFICELTIILVFIVLFSQIYSYEKSKKSSLLPLLPIFFLNINFYNLNIINYKNFYANSNIILNDFIYFYNTFFEKHILLTILILVIITLYSVFFILTYFYIKLDSNVNQKKLKNTILLRKQNIIHQGNYSSKCRIFKKIS